MRGATRPASAALSRSSLALRPRTLSSSSASPPILAVTVGAQAQAPSTPPKSANVGSYSPRPHHQRGGYPIPEEHIRERSGGRGFGGGVGAPSRVPDTDEKDGADEDRGTGGGTHHLIPPGFGPCGYAVGGYCAPLATQSGLVGPLPPPTARMFSSLSLCRGRNDGRIDGRFAESATRAVLVRNLSTTASRSSGGGKDDEADERSPDAAKPPNESAGEKFMSEENRATMKASAVRGGLRARELWQHYGVVFLGTYITVYCATLGLLFVGVNWGWMDASTITFGGEEGAAVGGADGPADGAGAGASEGHDGDGGGGGAAADGTGKKRASKSANAVIQFLEKYEYTQKWAEKAAKNPNYINLGIAWVATKFTEPLRLGVTIAVTPRVARFFGRGPPPEKGKDGDDNADKNKG